MRDRHGSDRKPWSGSISLNDTKPKENSMDLTTLFFFLKASSVAHPGYVLSFVFTDHATEGMIYSLTAAVVK